MNSTLYRKYRPQVFGEVVGQEHVLKTLERAIASDRVAHAYLFCGARGTGKTTVARLLAKAVNCTDDKAPNGKPCGKCANCLAIEAGNFIDLIEIDAASNRGIDEMRELRDKIKFTPSIGKKKVYIIDEVHMLTKEAFNAILKTLEEPPAHAIFIFATTEAHKLPQTIISRCQRFDFHLGETDLIKTSLEKIALAEKVKLPKEILDLLIKASGGSYRDAHSLLGQILPRLQKDELTLDEALKILNITENQKIVDFLEILRHGDLQKAIEYLAELSSQGVNFEQFLTELTVELRANLIEKIRSGENSDWEASSLEKMIKSFEKMKYSPSELLVLELLAIEIIRTESESLPRVSPRGQKVESQKVIQELPKEQMSSTVEIAVGIPPVAKAIVDEPAKAEKKEEAKPPLEQKLANKNAIPHLSVEQKLAIIEAVSAKNKTLGVMLGGSQWQIDGDKLKIQVDYQIHKTQITKKTALAILEQEAGAVLGEKIQIICEVAAKEDLGNQIGEVFEIG